MTPSSFPRSGVSNQPSAVHTIYGNGLASVNTFDRADQLMGINVGKGAKATFTYTRSGNGSLTGTTATGVAPTAESFGYDANNRLTSYNANPLTYDNSDNITKMADGSTLAYDDASQITSKTVGGVPTTYGYNPRGNRTSAGSVTYAYDQANRLTNYNSGAGTYTYDGDGLRASKTVAGNTSQFVYDIVEGLPLVLSDGANNYIYGPGGVPVSQINGSTVTYLHQDQLGSTRVLTDASRNVVAAYSYDPYGKTTSKTGTATTPMQYAGQYYDAESGLMWMRARYYDPNTGSFLTVDPLRDISRAPYNYANNEPTNFTDPSGEIVPLIAAGAVLGWGAIEVALTASDAYSTVKTVADPCATAFQKRTSVGLFAFGMVAPGGGYSTGARIFNVTKAESSVWKGFENFRGSTKTNGMSGRDRRYYEWDHTHNDIEVYDKKGKHLGSIHPETGETVKPPDPKKNIRGKI
jgi:RHS repeat-associated protein